MVIHSGISLTLHSPESLNILTPHALEEYLLPELDDVQEIRHAIATRYVPILPGSSFWISYNILKPPSPGDETKLYVFKLFIGHAHFTTWSVDGDHEKPERQWKGRCMFGFFEDPDVVDKTNPARRVFQKRGFSFAPPLRLVTKDSNKQMQDHEKQKSKDSDKSTNERRKLQKKRKSEDFVRPSTPPKAKNKKPVREHDERFIEVRTYRAKDKRRAPRDVPQFDPRVFYDSGGHGLDLKNAGYATRPFPRKYYEFDLIDPKEEPFATFRFYYRTMEELKALEIASSAENTPQSSNGSVDSQATVTPRSSPKENTRTGTSTASLKQKLEDARCEQQDRGCQDDLEDSGTSASASRQNTPAEVSVEAENAEQESPVIVVKRLSMPTSVRLLPSFGSWKRSSSPAKDLSGIDAMLRQESSNQTTRRNIKNLHKRSNQSLFRAFHEEREAEHGGY